MRERDISEGKSNRESGREQEKRRDRQTDRARACEKDDSQRVRKIVKEIEREQKRVEWGGEEK